MGCHCLDAIRTRDRRTDGPQLCPDAPWNDAALRVQAVINQSFAVEDGPAGWWISPYHFGIDQGPIVLAVENYRTGLLWNIMRPLFADRGWPAPGRLLGRVAVAAI